MGVGQPNLWKIGLQTQRVVDGLISQSVPRRARIPNKVQSVMGIGHQAIGRCKIRIQFDRFFKEAQSIAYWFLLVPARSGLSIKDFFLGLKIHVVCLYILGWFCLDKLLFFWRERS